MPFRARRVRSARGPREPRPRDEALLTCGGRLQVFVHAHEATTGRTSFASQHIVGFDGESKPVYQPVPASASAAQKNKSWREVVAKSTSVLTLIDLAGHEKYLKARTRARRTAREQNAAPRCAVLVRVAFRGVREQLGHVLHRCPCLSRLTAVVRANPN